MELFVNGERAVKGQEVVTFRGKKAILKDWCEPAHSSSSGRVIIQEIETGHIGEYFPGVIGGKFQ